MAFSDERPEEPEQEQDNETPLDQTVPPMEDVQEADLGPLDKTTAELREVHGSDES